VERLVAFRAARDAAAAQAALAALGQAAASGANLLPHLVECVDRNATLGEISDTLRGVFGEYREHVVV
jgi:methylmalonyl-CoA mutase N-terminal domain/subunit